MQDEVRYNIIANFRQQDEKGESKCDNQDGEDHQHFDEGLENFEEHDDVDADLVESLEKKE